jgi:hypothetical protein
MQFLENQKFVPAVRENYVSLARASRPKLFVADEAESEAKAISQFEKRKSDLQLQWKGISETGEIRAIGELRHKRYAHSVLKNRSGELAKIPDLKFDDLRRVVDETERLFAAIIILVYGAGAVSDRSFSAPLDLMRPAYRGSIDRFS